MRFCSRLGYRLQVCAQRPRRLTQQIGKRSAPALAPDMSLLPVTSTHTPCTSWAAAQYSRSGTGHPRAHCRLQDPSCSPARRGPQQQAKGGCQLSSGAAGGQAGKGKPTPANAYSRRRPHLATRLPVRPLCSQEQPSAKVEWAPGQAAGLQPPAEMRIRLLGPQPANPLGLDGPRRALAWSVRLRWAGGASDRAHGAAHVSMSATRQTPTTRRHQQGPKGPKKLCQASNLLRSLDRSRPGQCRAGGQFSITPLCHPNLKYRDPIRLD